MGTRHIIAVVLNKKFKVAQYGQWDGYLTGQGVEVAKFINKINNTKGLKEFKRNVKALKWATPLEVAQTWTDCGADPKSDLVSIDIAKICHEVNRAYCASVGDISQLPWEDAPEWQRASCTNGVESMLKNNSTPEQSHENWLKFKATDGWVYGDVKDAEKKTHPCFRPYGELPEEQRKKDALFHAVVNACRDWVG
jgi:hypothetical protein